MYPITPMQHCEAGVALNAIAAGVAGLAWTAAPAATGTTGVIIPASEAKLITFIIQYHGLVSGTLTRIGFGIQGTNTAPDSSPTYTNVRPWIPVASGSLNAMAHRFNPMSSLWLSLACSSTARTAQEGTPTALTLEQQAIEARRLTRLTTNGFIAWTVDLEKTGFLHHRLVINEVVGTSPLVLISASYFKTNLREHGSSHPYETSKDIGRPLAGFTDAQWAQYLDDGTIPSGVNQETVLALAQNRAPVRPAGLTNAQWDVLRNTIVDDGIHLQHRPEGV